MAQFSPRPDQLIGALDHVHYEIKQLAGTLIRSSNVVLHRALVESRLIHVRVLLDFFQKKSRLQAKGREHDDVLSLDYGFAAREIDVPRAYQERLDKDLAHLTYSRVARSLLAKQWPTKKVVFPVLSCCEEFVRHLISNYLPENCPEKVAQWQTLLTELESSFPLDENETGT